MTEEFKKKMSKAMENGILVAKKQDEEYLEKVNFNKEFADLYVKLVLAFVEKFDFLTGYFHYLDVSVETLKKFGRPRGWNAWVSEEESKGTISLDYSSEINPWIRAGEPEFKKLEKFDLSVVNDLLAENGIHVREDSVDGGGMGSQNDYISFDASMLIETRNKLMEESPVHFRKK